ERGSGDVHSGGNPPLPGHAAVLPRPALPGRARRRRHPAPLLPGLQSRARRHTGRGLEAPARLGDRVREGSLRPLAAALALLLAVAPGGQALARGMAPGPSLTYRLLARDIVIAADLWSPRPEILSAGYGFDGIIGVDGGEAEVRAAGGTWNTVSCTSGATPTR